MAKTTSLLTIRSRRPKPILICWKCLKRFHGGRKLKRDLKAELKRRSAAADVKRPRLVQTDCFGICPKRAVVFANGKMMGQGEYLLLSDSDGIADAAGLLMDAEQAEAKPKTDH